MNYSILNVSSIISFFYSLLFIPFSCFISFLYSLLFKNYFCSSMAGQIPQAMVAQQAYPQPGQPQGMMPQQQVYGQQPWVNPYQPQQFAQPQPQQAMAPVDPCKLKLDYSWCFISHFHASTHCLDNNCWMFTVSNWDMSLSGLDNNC